MSKPMRVWDTDVPWRDPEEAPHPLAETSDQVVDALSDLERHPASYLHWPWPALDAMTGGMAKGEVHYLAAFSGIGKTTFVSSATNRWLDQHKRVFVLPLETEPKRFRTYLACQRIGVHPGDAFSGLLRAENRPELQALEAEIRAQVYSPACDVLRVKGVKEINLKVFTLACEEAKDFAADVVIVDHIDHIESGDGTNLYAESVRVNKAAMKLAQKFGLILLLTSQLNTSAVLGPDRLAKFAPPREQYIKFGGHKREVASGMLGLFRPVRQPLPNEDRDVWKEMLRKARADEGVKPMDVLEPNTMGIVLMKDRNYGRDGSKIALRVMNGRVEDMPERDTHSGMFGYAP